jgi:iron complex transport system ATP-binding protein
MNSKATTPVLTIQSLDVSYGNRTVLHDIDLNLHQGEILALVGPNGAGKTTLIRAVSGLLPIDRGSVHLLKDNLASLNPTQRARYLAVVPQARNLPGAYTVQQTVAMGRTPYTGWMGRMHTKDRTLIDQVLTQTNTFSLSERPIGELSGGEQQRVLLARALAQDTPILLLDEPTAHLDLQHQSILLNLVASTAREKGISVLLAAHDLNLVSIYADRVAILVEGRIRALGSPQQVLTEQNIQAAYNVPVRIIPHPDYGTPLVLPDGHQPQPTEKAVKDHATEQFTHL